MNETPIIVATSNLHKLEELTQLFAMHGIAAQLRAMSCVVGDLHIEETGLTFEENAYIKAAAVYRATGLPVIADDSGLEVDALHGAPGVRSARYSGVDATDASNRSLLLHNMMGAADRTAKFRCVLCYVDGQRIAFGEGSCEGAIGHGEVGASGFGYDALFTSVGDALTFAELSPREKHARSHRGRAVADLINRLRDKPPSEHAGRLRTSLIRGSIAAATANDPLLQDALRDVTTEAAANAMYEALLQTYLFCGFPTALDALSVLSKHRVRHNLAKPLPLSEAYDVPYFLERGEDLCKTIYGTVYQRMVDRLDNVSPDLKTWMLVEGYGKTLARPSLSTLERELCIVAVLAATKRDSQLYSHIRGAGLVGATSADIDEVVNLVTEHCGKEQADAIRSVILDLKL